MSIDKNSFFEKCSAGYAIFKKIYGSPIEIKTPWDSKNPYVIAEIGLNHNGDINLAKAAIDAVACGVDAVKFQSFKVRNLLRRDSAKYEIMKELELNDEMHYLLHEHTKLYNIDFISSAFCTESVDFLLKLGADAIKIASCDATNYMLIDKVVNSNCPFIISTGYTSWEEVKSLIDQISHKGELAAVLHCVSSYPTEISNTNLKTISELRSLVDLHSISIGFSDHSRDTQIIPSIARSLGATIFEKHFTLDNTLEGFDHSMSLNPTQMKDYVEAIKLTDKVLRVNKIKSICL